MNTRFLSLMTILCLPARMVAGAEAAETVEAQKMAEPDAAMVKKAYGYGLFTAGMYYFSDKEMKKAGAAFDLSMENDPALGRAYAHQGDVFTNDKKYAEAVKNYEAALKLEPDFFFASYNLACAEAILGDETKALAAIEETLQSGYNRYDKMEQDEDFAGLRKNPKFGELLSKYRKAPVKQTDVAKFLLATNAEKLGMIEAILHAHKAAEPVPAEAWKPVADKALLNSEEQVRIGGLLLYVDLGGAQRLEPLVRALFDNNGYVSKFAANALVAIDGDDAWVDAVLASNYDDAKFFARQIKRLKEAKKETGKTVKPPETTSQGGNEKTPE